MANIDAAYGFRCIGTTHGGAPHTERCYFGGASNTFLNDIVKADVVADTSGAGVPAFERIAAGTDTFFGVVLDKIFEDPDANHNTKYLVASAGGYADVIIDKDALYEVQVSAEVADDFVYSDVPLNADPTTGAGNTSTGYSGMELDASTIDTANTRMFQIIKLVPSPDNALGAWGKAIVKPNESYWNPARTGVS